MANERQTPLSIRVACGLAGLLLPGGSVSCSVSSAAHDHFVGTEGASTGSMTEPLEGATATGSGSEQDESSDAESKSETTEGGDASGGLESSGAGSSSSGGAQDGDCPIALVEITPEEFTADDALEDFEGITGTLLPLFQVGTTDAPGSYLPDEYVMPSMLTWRTDVHDDMSIDHVWDFYPPGYVGVQNAGFGAALGPKNSIYGPPGSPSNQAPGVPGTTIPSGGGFLYDWSGSSTIAFPYPVSAVGSFFEAYQYLDELVQPELTLRLFAEDGCLLGETTATGDGVADDQALDSWIGLAAADGEAWIHAIELIGPPASFYVYPMPYVLDDLRFRGEPIIE